MNHLPCLAGIPMDALGYVRLDHLNDDRLLALFAHAETVCFAVPENGSARDARGDAAMRAATTLFSETTPAYPFETPAEHELVRDFRTALESYFGSPPLLKLEWEAPADEWLLALSFVPGDALHLQTVAFAERGGTQADVTTECDLLVFRLPH